MERIINQYRILGKHWETHFRMEFGKNAFIYSIFSKGNENYLIVEEEISGIMPRDFGFFRCGSILPKTAMVYIGSISVQDTIYNLYEYINYGNNA